LRELPEEPTRSNNTVATRIRLPNGVQCSRLFDCKATIEDIKLWINHTLIDNDLTNLINNFQLVSAMPRTIYKDDTITLEKLGFWQPNAKNECRTPILYIEECTISPDDHSHCNHHNNNNNNHIQNTSNNDEE